MSHRIQDRKSVSAWSGHAIARVFDTACHLDVHGMNLEPYEPYERLWCVASGPRFESIGAGQTGLNGYVQPTLCVRTWMRRVGIHNRERLPMVCQRRAHGKLHIYLFRPDAKGQLSAKQKRVRARLLLCHRPPVQLVRARPPKTADVAAEPSAAHAPAAHLTAATATATTAGTELAGCVPAVASPSDNGPVDRELIALVDDALVGLIGMDEQRAWMLRLARAKRAFDGHESTTGHRVQQTLHARLVGPPGSGKTQFAERLGPFFHKIGLARRPETAIIGARQLVARHIGHTDALVRARVKEALGGVLYIDEAYALITDGSSRDFGHEAVATLLELLELHRDDLVVVFGGYSAELDSLLSVNPGLRSRVPTQIEFGELTPDQALQAFLAMAVSDGIVVAPDLPTTWRAMSTLFVLPCTGRGVRNLYERVLRGPVSARHARTGGQMTIKVADLADVKLSLHDYLAPHAKHLDISDLESTN